MRQLWRYLKTILGVIFRHPIVGVTLIPVLSDGRIVLIRRRDTGQWGLPGGFIDWGEDLATAAHRELAEETGLTLVDIRRLVGVYSSPDRDPRIHSISIAIAVAASGTLAIEDALEVADVKPFEIEDLPLGRLSHDHDRQLGDYLQGETGIR